MGQVVRGWGLLAGCLSLAVASLSAETYYVSANEGDDWAFDGLSPTPSGGSGPFRSIERAVSLAGPGDEVLVGGGNYVESVSVGNSGTAGAPIVIAAREGEEVTMTPAGFSAFYLSSRSWVTIRGIDFAEADGVSAITILGGEGIRIEDCGFRFTTGANALYAENSEGVVVEESAFADNAEAGAYFRNSSGVFAGNSLVRHRSTHALILEGPGTAGFRVAGNTFTDNYPLPVRGHSVVFVLDGGTGIVLEENTVSNGEVPTPTGAVPSGDFVAGILASGTDGITIRGNTVRDLQYPGTVDFRATNPAYYLPPAEGGLVGYGIQVNGTGFDTVREASVVNNFVKKVAGNGIHLASADDSTVAGNEVAECGAYGIFVGGLAGDHAHVTGNVVRGNRVSWNGWLHGGASGIGFWQVGAGNIARGNLAWRNRQGTAGRTGFDWFADGHGLIADIDSDGTVFVNNICFDNEGAGIAINESDDCVAVHNTLVGNGYCPHWEDRPGLVVGTNDAEHTAQNSFVANNVMANNRVHQFGVYAYTSFDHTVHHNLYAAGDLTTAGTAGAPIQFQGPKTLAQWQSMGGGKGAGAIEATPDFRGGDPQTIAAWALRPGSPGRDGGALIANYVGRTLVPVDSDANLAPRDVSAPNLGAVEEFPGGFAGIEALVLEAVFPDQWVAVNVWDYGNNRWVLPEHRLVHDLASLEVRNLAGNRWYGVSVWSYAESRWYGMFVSLLNGSSAMGPPTVHPVGGASEGPPGIRGVERLELRCAGLAGAGWVANGLWSDRGQAWVEPLANALEPAVFSVAENAFPSGAPDDWFWAGMWHYDGGSWAPGTWLGLFGY